MSRVIATMIIASTSIVMVSSCSVARHQESMGEYVDGSVITTEVKAKLANDSETSAANINVKTIEGGEVQLSGFTNSQAEKNRAAELARSVKGVTKVHNDLIVK
ncbi:BON domain-containing protein [Nitrosomonas sp. HPC101]|uniref:BON domain-containing protein n=1 Tax=Nitrosomonas sp. HPC101 TaxID=1658667 RepID=UPI001F03D2CC|nr:BON domain-containing protein [Nitrosomonas sp. HPC101]